MQLSDDQWRDKLTPQQYRILRQKGTEAPFSGTLLRNDASGDYACAGCGTVLFTSDAKYESDMPGLQGWPSFADAAASQAVALRDDDSFGMRRTEVVCRTCGGHLGHVFPDASSPTGQHYCINSGALAFESKTEGGNTQGPGAQEAEA